MNSYLKFSEDSMPMKLSDCEDLDIYIQTWINKSKISLAS